MPQGVVLSDTAGRILLVNASLERMLGYARAELIGASIEVLVPERLRAIHRTRREGHVHAPFTRQMGIGVELFARHKGGADVPVEIGISTVQNPEGSLHLSCIIDITERARIQREAMLHLEEVRAIYLLSNAVGGAESIEQVYQEAMDSLVHTLKVDRVAIVLFDPDGGWRFKAWRGLSETYRKAAEGHSPWTRDSRDPQPVLVEDARQDPDLLALRAVLEREGVRALAFVPLALDGRLIGKFMLYFDAPHRFVESEIKVARTIAYHVASAIVRKRAEEMLKRRTSLLITTFENMAQGISVFDKELRLIGFNRAFLRLFEFPVSFIVENIAIEDMFRFNAERGEYGPGIVEQQVQTRVALAKQMLPHRFKRIRPNGVVLEIVGTPLPEGGFVTTYTDVTEQERAQAALRLSEQRYRLLVDLSPDAIYVQRRRKILFANEAALKLWGVDSPDQVIGGDLLDFIDPAFHPLVIARMEALESALAAETRMPWSVQQYRRSDGNLVPVEASATRIELDDGVATLSVARDVTARRSLEAQLRQSQKMEAIGTLAGGIAHDFNNILGAILGNVALARQDLEAGHPVLESLEEIGKAGGRATELVQQILAFSRNQTPQRRVIGLHNVIEEVARLMRKTLPAGVDISAVLATDAPKVLADQTQIQQVLMNLCTNAWQAFEQGAGRIEIRLDRLDVEEGSAAGEVPPGAYARVEVADNARGMDAATVERIFEPFFTTRAKAQGTGLGLSVAHGIVNNHDGFIGVRSELGKGTTFTLCFPMARPEHGDAPAAIAPAEAPRGRGQHILFLDDEDALVFLARRMLVRLGYRVSGFSRCEEALAAFRADPLAFDLVISDFNMPVRSGLEVAREVLALRPEMPVVLASGYITDELTANARALGVAEVVYKPNTVEELARIIHRLASAQKNSQPAG